MHESVALFILVKNVEETLKRHRLVLSVDAVIAEFFLSDYD
jgi:hypothetical protein